MMQIRSSPSLAGAMLAVCCLFNASNANSKSNINLDTATGRELMQAGYDQHLRYPFIYEELSMVTHDRKGNKETKSLRFFSRAESVNHIKLLLLFDSPQEVAGVAFLAQRRNDGKLVSELHLPAFEQTMIRNSGNGADINFLDTDFTLENLIGEDLDQYYYKRQRDAIVDGNYYYVIDVYHASVLDDDKQKLLRRHYLLQDNLFITRTDYFDSTGRMRKRQSAHDLVQVTRHVWNANMRLMEDFLRESKTLFKVNRRVYSADYVPEKVFTAQWLYENGKRDLTYEIELSVEQEIETQIEKKIEQVKTHTEQHEVEPS